MSKPLAVGLLFLTAAAISAGSLLPGFPEAARLIAGLLFAWLVPGYSLVFALFGRAPEGAEQLGFSVGGSLIIAALVGVLFDRAGVGVNSGTLVLSLGLLSAVFFAIGLYRQRQAFPLLSIQQRGWRPLGHPVVLIGAALALVGSGLWTAQGLAAADHPSGKAFTVLALQDAGVNGSPSTRVVVDNHEGRTVRYRLQLAQPGVPARTWESGPISAGSQWTIEVPQTVGTGGRQIFLYSADSSQLVESARLP